MGDWVEEGKGLVESCAWRGVGETWWIMRGLSEIGEFNVMPLGCQLPKTFA